MMCAYGMIERFLCINCKDCLFCKKSKGLYFCNFYEKKIDLLEEEVWTPDWCGLIALNIHTMSKKEKEKHFGPQKHKGGDAID